MSALNINGVEYPLTDDGRLQSSDNWNKDVALALAEDEGVILTDAHWEVIDFLRNYYTKYNIVPALKLFKKTFAHDHGAEKAEDAYLDKLFPAGVSLQASRIAGLPTPHMASLITGEKGSRSDVTSPDKDRQSSISNLVSEFEFDGNVYHLTPSGNLVERNAWNERLAEYLASTQGIELTDEHWEIVRFIRDFYAEYAIAPMVKLLIKHLRQSGMDPAKCTKAYLYELFPGGPAKQGSLIGGLAEPPGCVD